MLKRAFFSSSGFAVFWNLVSFWHGASSEARNRKWIFAAVLFWLDHCQVIIRTNQRPSWQIKPIATVSSDWAAFCCWIKLWKLATLANLHFSALYTWGCLLLVWNCWMCNWTNFCAVHFLEEIGFPQPNKSGCVNNLSSKWIGTMKY